MLCSIPFIREGFSPWQFASKRYDLITGFHQFGKRDYDSQIGRWITPDPTGFGDGPNLYAYVHNNPLIFYDPWGLQTRGEHQAECFRRGAEEYGRGVKNGLSRPYETSSQWVGYAKDLGRAIWSWDFSEIREKWNKRNCEAQRRFVNERAGESTVALLSMLPVGRALAKVVNFGCRGYQYFQKVNKENSSSLPVKKLDSLTEIVPQSTIESEKIISIMRKIEEFLGKESKAKLNSQDDLIIESADGLRQFRMDLNNPKPHKNSHVHLVTFRTMKNSKRQSWNERIFPKDVNPE